MNARIEKYLVAYNLVQLTGWLAAIIVLPFNLLFLLLRTTFAIFI